MDNRFVYGLAAFLGEVFIQGFNIKPLTPLNLKTEKPPKLGTYFILLSPNNLEALNALSRFKKCGLLRMFDYRMEKMVPYSFKEAITYFKANKKEKNLRALVSCFDNLKAERTYKMYGYEAHLRAATLCQKDGEVPIMTSDTFTPNDLNFLTSDVGHLRSKMNLKKPGSYFESNGTIRCARPSEDPKARRVIVEYGATIDLDNLRHALLAEKSAAQGRLGIDINTTTSERVRIGNPEKIYVEPGVERYIEVTNTFSREISLEKSVTIGGEVAIIVPFISAGISGNISENRGIQFGQQLSKTEGFSVDGSVCREWEYQVYERRRLVKAKLPDFAMFGAITFSYVEDLDLEIKPLCK